MNVDTVLRISQRFLTKLANRSARRKPPADAFLRLSKVPTSLICQPDFHARQCRLTTNYYPYLLLFIGRCGYVRRGRFLARDTTSICLRCMRLACGYNASHPPSLRSGNASIHSCMRTERDAALSELATISMVPRMMGLVFFGPVMHTYIFASTNRYAPSNPQGC